MAKKTKNSPQKEQRRKKNGQYDTMPISPISPAPAPKIKTSDIDTNIPKACPADNPARRAWEAYLQNQEDNTRCFMGYTYRIISSKNQITHIEIWNAEKDTWTKFALHTPPNASEERKHEYIKATISSLRAHPSNSYA